MTVDDMISDILEREGGYVNHPADRGGETNYGITKETLAMVNPDLDIKLLTKSEAAEIYRRAYYYRPKINEINKHVQPVVFDMAVNHGPVKAIKMLQECINEMAPVSTIAVDGLIGPVTVSASQWVTTKELIKRRIEFYADIVANDHSQAVFLKGWLNRAREFA